MPVLNANASINLGPYPRGARLILIAPQTDNIFSFPQLNNVPITLTYVPKSLTLAQETAYTLNAGNVALTYDVQQ